MAHIHKKIKKGRPYYYVREIARVNGKPKVVNQVYLGSAERIMALATGAQKGCSRLQAQEFGALWLANLVDSRIGIAELVDRVVPPGKAETGPSVGEYFLYAVLNRMVDARSKRALPEWYEGTAIQQIRPVDVNALTSQRFWKKWERVTADHLAQIAKAFFRRLAEIEPSSSDCFMFDTTNYYTFMAGNTESELARRGKNKDGRNWLRQVGVALLVSRDKKLPLFYREYEGNRHDSRLFSRVADELFAAMEMAAGTEGEMTIVFDKGMNSAENIAAIDARKRLHFITTYSPHYVEDLVQAPRDERFRPVDTRKNRELAEKGRLDDQLLAWRTTGEYWGRERTVIVTYNPRTATRQRYAFERKMLRLQDELYAMRARINGQFPKWNREGYVRKYYKDVCDQLHLPDDLYTIEIFREGEALRFLFRKNHYRISKYINKFGKNIIITDHVDWSTDEIVRASLDRYSVEESFRLSKDDNLISLRPFRHWTDSKVRCHIFTCIVALAYLRLVELTLKRAGLSLSVQAAMDHMHRLHSCLVWHPAIRRPQRLIEEPNKIQAAILAAFGYEVKDGVLQEAK